MSVDCEQVHPWLDGTLEPAQRGSFEQHLAGCSACQADVRAWEQLKQRFVAATRPLLEAPPPAETARLMAKVSQPGRGTFRLAFGGALAVLWACVAAWWVLSLRAEAPGSIEVAQAGRLHRILPGETVEGSEAEPARLTWAAAQAELRGRVQLVSNTHRDVRMKLDRGRVELKVAKRTTEQSFVVEAGGYEVRVVGTQFVVERDAKGIRVQVSEGQVRLLGGGDERLLSAGESWPPPSVETAREESAPDAGGSPVDDGVEAPGVEAPVAPVRGRAATVSQLRQWHAAALAGKCGEVIGRVRAHLANSPKDGPATGVLADCLRKTGATAEAVAAYRRVVALEERAEADRARLMLAELHQQRDEHRAAERVLREFLAARQSPELEAAARVRLARSLLAQGQKAKARAELEWVTRKLPGTPAGPQALELLEQLK